MYEVRNAWHRAAVLIALATPFAAMAQAAADDDHPRFIGPLASPAPPLPKGAWNIEPYLVSSHAPEVFDAHGHRQDAEGSTGWDLLVPIQHGLTDRLTLGGTLAASYDVGSDGSRHARVGDTTLSAQYGLYDGGGVHRPRLAASLRRGLPTGHHDRLESGDKAGTGNGAHTTALGLNGQAYFLEGLLRTRAAMTWRPPGAHAGIRGESTYGTAAGFQGRATLGSAFSSSVSAEYSVDPHWTLVGEALYERGGSTRVAGRLVDGTAWVEDAPLSWRLSVLPAIQYHLSDRVGVIGGVQIAVAGRNTAAVVAPQVAVNLSF